MAKGKAAILPMDNGEKVGPSNSSCCSCLITRAQTINLKVYLVFVVLLSVVLVVFMTTRLSHKRSGFQVQDDVMLNDSLLEYQLVVNMTETKGV